MFFIVFFIFRYLYICWFLILIFISFYNNILVNITYNENCVPNIVFATYDLLCNKIVNVMEEDFLFSYIHKKLTYPGVIFVHRSNNLTIVRVILPINSVGGMLWKFFLENRSAKQTCIPSVELGEAFQIDYENLEKFKRVVSNMGFCDIKIQIY